MLASFLSVLDVRTRRATLSVTDEAKKAVLAEIQTSLNTFKDRFAAASDDAQAWNECYRLERLMVLIEPAENLWPELQRRVAEADEEKLASAPRLAAAADAARQLAFDAQAPHGLRPGGEELLRSNLLDVLEEIHLAVQRKFYSRPIRRSATRRIVWAGMLAFLLFIMPYIVLYICFALTGRHPVEGWSWLPFYTALTSGLFGALFSRVLFLQSNWENLTIGGLKAARDYTSILLRGCVGMTGAVIVSFFLLSNVVGGGLFPTFSEIGLDTASYPKIEGSAPHLSLIYPSKSLALLVVWTFLAGFSERLVPSLLQDTETSIAKSSASK